LVKQLAFACVAASGFLIATVGVEAEDLSAARLCAANADAAARLACYDAAFAEAPATSTAEFGDNEHLQKQRAPKVDLPKSLELRVKSAQPLLQGLYRLTLENGQIWETRQAERSLAFKASDIVTISRLPLGSYLVSMKGNPRSVGAKRIQ
jgi:hypothetical protein